MLKTNDADMQQGEFVVVVMATPCGMVSTKIAPAAAVSSSMSYRVDHKAEATLFDTWGPIFKNLRKNFGSS